MFYRVIFLDKYYNVTTKYHQEKTRHNIMFIRLVNVFKLLCDCVGVHPGEERQLPIV